MGKIFSHLTWTDRLLIERGLREGKSRSEIARVVGKSRNAVCAELKRAPNYQRRDGKTWKSSEEYSPELAEERYRNNLSLKGKEMKIGSNYALAEFLEHKIADIKNGKTVRDYIRKGVFFQLEIVHLPRHGKQKRKYNHVRKVRRLPKDPSIGITAEDRTKFYYCHSFSSWERGSNENANIFIRRHIPKGTRIEKYSTEEIKRIQDWLNDYPRLILGWRCAGDVWREEMRLSA